MKYALITSARNEEEHIERAIKAVISQTIPPLKWIIVSDGSTDRTEEIVSGYSNSYDFIEILSTNGDLKRNFGSKAKAIRLGYDCLSSVDYDYIGNLDADISFEPTYYESILERFKGNARLGVAGGIRYDYCNGKFVEVFYSRNSIAGAFQLFERQCYEAIGGYMELKYGGMDAVAEIMARMHGWEVEAFPEVKVYHHRATGSATENFLEIRFRYGVKYYVIGYHPIFLALMVFRRMLLNRTYLLGGPIECFGFIWASLFRYEKAVSADFISYLRAGQLKRLKSTLLLKTNDPSFRVGKV